MPLFKDASQTRGGSFFIVQAPHSLCFPSRKHPFCYGYYMKAESGRCDNYRTDDP